MNNGTPVFSDKLYVKLPKPKDETEIRPEKVFEGYTQPAAATKQKAAYKKVSNRGAMKKKKQQGNAPPMR